jgi:hypothetical protein
MPMHRIAAAAQHAGSEARIAVANQKVTELAPVTTELIAAGITSSSGIAAALNAHGVRTTWGHRHRYASQVTTVATKARFT